MSSHEVREDVNHEGHEGHEVRIIFAFAFFVVYPLFVSSALAQEGGGGRPVQIAGCPSPSREFYPCAKPKAEAFNPPRNAEGTPNMNGAWNPVTANGSQNIED